MSSVNKAIIIGNLGRDPELRSAGQSQVCEFSVATADKRGQQERTDWHRVITWGKTAEACAKYLSKGSQVYAEGRIQYRDWTDKDGNKRQTTEIVADTVQFLTRGSGGGGGGNRDSAPATGGNSAPAKAFHDSDIPF